MNSGVTESTIEDAALLPKLIFGELRVDARAA